MFDKLILVLENFSIALLPGIIIEQWNQGVHLRFGKYLRVVQPGLRFKIPVIDTIVETAVITQSVNLPAQTLTTYNVMNKG